MRYYIRECANKKVEHRCARRFYGFLRILGYHIVDVANVSDVSKAHSTYVFIVSVQSSRVPVDVFERGGGGGCCSLYLSCVQLIN
jgi:hypothetical protein